MQLSVNRHKIAFLFLFTATLLVSMGASMTIAAASDMSYTGKPFTGTRSNSRVSTKVQTADVFNIGDKTRPSQDAIDVSSYQANMTQNDYNLLAKKGVKSVIVKLTEGSNYTNPYAITQMKRAANAGLNVNIYHYANFSTKAQATTEANYLIKALKNNGVNTKIKIFADMESQASQNDNVAANLKAFWSKLSTGGYKNHGVYTYTKYLYRSAVINTVGQNKTWIAQYPYQPSAKNLLHSEFGAWQFSQTAQISGGSYAGNVDVSHDYKGLFTGGAGSNPF